MDKIADLRTKDKEELLKDLATLRRSLLNFRVQKATQQQSDKTHQFAQQRKKIARVKMVLLEKGLKV